MRQSYCVDCLCPPCVGLMMHTTHLDNSFNFFFTLELLLLLYFMSMYALPACMSVYLVAAEVQTRVLVPQEQELQTVVSCHVCMGILTQVVCRAMSALICWAVSPVLLTPLHFIWNWWALKFFEGFFFLSLNSVVWKFLLIALRIHGSFSRYYKNKIVLHSSSMW